MQKEAWNQKLVIVGLSMVLVMMNMTAQSASAAIGEVKSIAKVKGGPNLIATNYFGGSVARIGDLDGDGVEDLAAGARGDDDGAVDAGAVYVLFMNTNGTVKSYQKISETHGNGPDLDANDSFGTSVADIGDLDGDGVKDLAAGANGDDDGATAAGAVYVLFMNKDGTVKSYQKISKISGNGPNLDGIDYFGCSVAGIEDLDKDGVKDLAAGAYADDDGATDAGAVYVLFMNTNGTVKSYQKICQTNGVPELAAGDAFGISVGGIGDLNGDGVEDLAAGAYADDDGAVNAGAVYVLFMNTNGTVKSNQKICQTNGVPELAGTNYFGVSVAGIEDLDGDGVNDLAAGAFYDDDGAVDAGAVYVLFMNTNGTVKSYQKICQTNGVPELDASDYFGRSVAGIGDLDGDGVKDLAAGAYADDDGAVDAGAVYVLFMNTNGTVKSYQKISDTSGSVGPDLAGSDFFGTSVAGIGDLDKDGVEDLAAGAQGDDDGTNNAGAVYVLFMNMDGTLKSYQKITDGSGGGPTLDTNDQFGASVAAIGDLDKDGVDDLAAGAHGDDDGGTAAGAVYVLFMNTNGTVKSYQKISKISGNGPNLDGIDYFGCSVAGIEDLDKDGVKDIAAGAYADDDGATDAGAVYVLFMNTNGTVKSYQKICQTNGVPELAAGDAFGISVGGIGDLNGDGVEDLAAGAYADDDGAVNAGAVYVLFMNTNGTVKSYQKICQTNGVPELAGTNYFGVSVAGIGDLDADRVRDLAVGAFYDDDGAVNAGAVYVLFMNKDGTVKSYQKISKISGNGPNLDANDYFGRSVAGIGDMDGDWVEDIAAGAYGDDDGAADTGAIYILMMEGTPIPPGTIFYAF